VVHSRFLFEDANRLLLLLLTFQIINSFAQGLILLAPRRLSKLRVIGRRPRSTGTWIRTEFHGEFHRKVRRFSKGITWSRLIYTLSQDACTQSHSNIQMFTLAIIVSTIHGKAAILKTKLSVKQHGGPHSTGSLLACLILMPGSKSGEKTSRRGNEARKP